MKMLVIFLLSSLVHTSPVLSSDSMTEAEFSQILACTFDYNEGSTVDLNASRSPEIVEGVFGKVYDLSWIKALAQASTSSTIAFIQFLGVDLMAVDLENNGGCPIESLPAAPADFVDDFIKQGGNVAAGIYLPIGAAILGTYKPNRPVILVERSPNRWTLLHELMHHNFRLHGQAYVEVDYSSLFELTKNPPKSFTLFVENPTQDNLDAFLNEYLILATLTANYIKTFPLEEVAVEIELLKLQQRLKFTQIHFYSPSVAISYLRANQFKAEQVREIFKFYLEGKLKYAVDTAKKRNLNWDVPSYQKALSNLRDLDKKLEEAKDLATLVIPRAPLPYIVR